ncbi:SAM-dependent methyltransferase [Paroceanicella profunda]|uniref:SAM-dependent methyltransferase n=1 Tax=Paroceanicella profunda TaxID=2579971 RepID=A0A5B8FIL8_9RHOB|nr:methyltransferase domain-containing protein [Paroceanicella profunda]QDL93228.1 SAM-dependent methyltransferase [Paroceanicella profunda]
MVDPRTSRTRAADAQGDPELTGATAEGHGARASGCRARPRGQAVDTCAETSDTLRFLRSWRAAPLRVAAIAPSGGALAALITSEIGMHHAPVLELGPGTGVFTKALIARGLDPEALTLIELDAGFASLLRARFPQVQVLEMSAERLRVQQLFGGRKAGAAVSGLGLLSMPPRTVMAILTGTFRHLRPGAALYQFTYGPRCPVPRPMLDRLGLDAKRIGGTFRNLPPASVYRISRVSAAPQHLLPEHGR